MFKSYFDENLSKLRETVRPEHVSLVVGCHMFCQFRSERDTIEHSKPPEVVAAFWKVVSYRPDIGYKLKDLLKGKDFLLPQASDMLLEALKKGKWPDDKYW